MKKFINHAFYKFLLFSALLALAVACGGGGGGGSDSGVSIDSSSQSTGSLRAKLDATKLANLQLGDTLYFYNLDFPSEIEKSIEITEENLTSVQVIFTFGVDYQLIIKRKGVDFLSTIIREEQIDEAALTGVLTIGRINSITTFLSHVIDSKIENEGQDSSAAIDEVLNDYFVGQEDLSGFSFSSFFPAEDSSIELTDLFYSEAANRINALSGYVDIIYDIDSSLITDLNNQKMKDLFNAILTGGVDEWSEMAQLANDEFDFNETGFEEAIKDILFDNGETTHYVLDESDLKTIFFDPAEAQDVSLFDLVVDSPDSTITGTIIGAGATGVDVYVIDDVSGGVVQTTSDDQGNFSFEGLKDNNQYTLKLSKAGFVYRQKVVSGDNLVFQGLDVDKSSIVVVDNKITLGDNISHAVSFDGGLSTSSLTVDGSANLNGIIHPTGPGSAGQFLRVGADGNLYFATFDTLTVDTSDNPWTIAEGGLVLVQLLMLGIILAWETWQP